MLWSIVDHMSKGKVSDTNPVFKFHYCVPHEVFCINFDFLNYCIKLIFVCIPWLDSTSLNLLPKEVPHSPHPSPSSTTQQERKRMLHLYILQHRWLSTYLPRESIEEVGQKRVHVICFHLYIILENENKSIHSDRKPISGFLGKERAGRRNYKGTQRNFWQEWIWSLSWLWWWFHKSIHISKQTKSCIFNVRSLLYVSYTSVKLFFKK